MSVTLNEVVAYGSANMPEADGVTIGGAVDFTKRISFFDIAASGTFDAVSSSASDTAVKLQVTGRDSAGVIQTPAAITLTGTTLLAATFAGQSFERLLAGVITGGAIGSLVNPTGTAAVGDIAVMATTRVLAGRTAQAGSANKSGTTPPLFKLQSGDGATINALAYQGLGLIIRTLAGTGPNQLRMISAPYLSGAYGADFVAVNRDWTITPDATTTYDLAYGMLFDILPSPVKAITRVFSTAQADIPGGSSRTFYEKFFMVNTNTVTTLTGAAIQIFSETPALPSSPQALLDLALCTALNDTNTAANRQTLPTGIAATFTPAQPSAINVPGAGNLPAGATPNAAGAEGCWLRLTLPAGTTVYKGTADVRTTGATT